MNSFVSMLQTWQVFYSTVAIASATVAGLLFVALSINWKHLDELARQYARSSFTNLVDVLVLALMFLIPHEDATGLSVTLFLFGLVRLITIGIEAAVSIRSAGKATGLRLHFFPGILAVAVLIVALAVYLHVRSALFWPIVIIIAQLAAASRNAWEIIAQDDSVPQRGEQSAKKLTPTPSG